MLNARKQRNDYQWATYVDNFSRVFNQEFFFWFTSSRFCKQPALFEVLAPASFFLQGSHMQREYRRRTTLPSKISTIKGLLYAPDPDECKKGTLSNQPQLSRVTSTVLLCCWERSCSKIWCPSWLTLRRMPYGRGMLMIPLQGILKQGRPALSPWAKCTEAVIRHVGTLPDGYLKSNPLPQVPTKQSALTSKICLPPYLGLPIAIPTLCKIVRPAIAKARIPWWFCSLNLTTYFCY